MAKRTVYHGGYTPVEDPEICVGRNIKDLAQRWARRYDAKIVSIYDVRLNQDLNIKEFREMTDEWLDFIFCMWSD